MRALLFNAFGLGPQNLRILVRLNLAGPKFEQRSGTAASLAQRVECMGEEGVASALNVQSRRRTPEALAQGRSSQRDARNQPSPPATITPARRGRCCLTRLI